MKRDLLSIQDLSSTDLHSLLDAAAALKSGRPSRREALSDHTMALIFEKPSLRTRVSFELAMTQLGGSTVVLSAADVQLGIRESIPDVARTLAGYVQVIVGRVFRHTTLEALAQHATVPVINGLSDVEHPCQILADLLTLRESLGDLAGRTLAFVGDGNNVAGSLLLAAPMLGMNVCVASPAGYEPSESAVTNADRLAHEGGSWVEICSDPATAVRSADAVYADAWYSMGQEHEADVRREVFRSYQVNRELLRHAPSHTLTMHCLPAHRGDEITDDVLDSDACLAFTQAANRLHVQKAVLFWVLDKL